MATLAARELTRAYPGTEADADADEGFALRAVDFEVADGRVAALLGPSGCGKTTLLRLIAGLDRPDAGDVLLDGESLLGRQPHRRGIGLVFQELALFPHLDVAANVDFGLRMARWPRDRRRERVAELLALFELDGLGGRRIHELSGGERQRVALARAVAPEPGVLLLDEPLGSLDEPLKAQLRPQLRALLGRLGTTALLVSHDLRDAVEVADDLLVMVAGRLLQAGPLPQVFASPASLRVAEMLGYVTLAHGPLRPGEHGRPAVVEEGVGALELPPALAQVAAAAASAGGGALRVLAHPASLLGVPTDRGLGCGAEGRVRRVRPEGPLARVELALGRGGEEAAEGSSIAGPRSVEVRWEWDAAPPAPGTRLAIAARPETLRLFGPSGAALTPEAADGASRAAPGSPA
jgi:thiamine transport system ATP-binding protein